MLKQILLGICGFLVLSCASPTDRAEPVPAQANYFENMEGCFLLYNMKTKQFDKVIGDENCRKQYPACSTFKVPLAVMAFDSGVLKNENVVLKWDGKKDSREEVNRDHDAKSWMKDSVVWFSQRITPKLGQAKFQSYLDKFNYGNKDISAGITNAWLVSPASTGPALKISAYEQIDFMKALWTNSLPASKKAMALTQKITFLETSPKGAVLSGKTGSGFFDEARKTDLGWFVSHVQIGEQEYLTAANFRDLGPTEDKGYGGPRAKAITKQILADMGLW